MKSTEGGMFMSHLIRMRLPDISVYGYCQGESRRYTREDLLGHWSVLFFYPADFTFVCPTELKDLQAYYDDFLAENCRIFSVSMDTHFVHKAWADASQTIRDLEFVMLADPAGVLSRAYGVLLEEEGQALRATFLLNPEGEVVLYEIHDLGIGRSAAELLRKVQAARFVAEHGDQVCPASWQPGEQTLTPSLDLVGLL
jgi:peroxiredoxin (alkyl hydroperoxide reductase subunit C)